MDKVTRKLAAIMATDMVGYSRLIGVDEVGTITRQKSHRAKLIDPHIAEHNGRIVKTTGDGLLVEFASAVDAVLCAVAVQRAMVEREADISEDRRIVYRIGINLGEIVIDDDDIFGDGVNVAARLEARAEPGGILISDVVFNNVRGKIDLGFANLGPQRFKNIAEPVSTYKVLLDPAEAGTIVAAKRTVPTRLRWVASATVAMLLLMVVGMIWWRPWVSVPSPPVSKKPSIAVLAFSNLSGDKTQEYFADGMTDDLITGLSKVSGLIVISRTSSFTFKGKKVKIEDIARALGVRYVLEGSVRRAGGKIRINAQLINGITGAHVWAETFDREYKQIFALQDEVKRKIVQALKVKLTPKERRELKRKTTENLEAYDFYLKAEQLRRTFRPKHYGAALALYDKALKLDPNFIDAHVGNARASFRAWRLFWVSIIHTAKAKARAHRSLAKALALDPDNARVLAHQANMQLHFGNHDVAQSVARGAVARHPKDPNLWAVLGRVLLASDRLDEARLALRRAEALAQRRPFEWIVKLAMDHLILGDARRAVPLLLRARKFGGSRYTTALHLTNAYAQLDQMKKAKVEYDTARKYWSWVNISSLRNEFAHYRNKRLLENYLSAYRKVGILD